MMIITKIREFFASLEERTFYYYVGGFLVLMFLFSCGIVYYVYSSTSDLMNDIEAINEERSSVVRGLLEKGKRIKAKQKEINKMLAEDPTFKIGGEFNELCKKNSITPIRLKTSQTDLDDSYQESMVTAEFDGISMKQLLEFLQVIEKIERMYVKQLDIGKSKNTSGSLDVKMIVATLLPKILQKSE